MPDLRDSYLRNNPHFHAYFEDTHQAGALDSKTKELLHLALVLAYHCEP